MFLAEVEFLLLNMAKLDILIRNIYLFQHLYVLILRFRNTFT